MKRARPPKAPGPIDKRIGKNITAARARKGMAQEKLAEKVGVTFQQIQKYEWALNRVSAARLYDIARALDEPVASFYEEA